MSKKSARFVKLPVEVMARRDLSTSAKLVYAALSNHVRYFESLSKPCHVGIETLARECGIGRCTTLRAIESLDAAGLIIVSRDRNADGQPSGRPNTYTLPDETSDKMSHPPSQNDTGTSLKTIPVEESTTSLKMIHPPSQNDTGTSLKTIPEPVSKRDCNKNRSNKKEVKDSVASSATPPSRKRSRSKGKRKKPPKAESDPRVKEFVDAFCALYERETGTRYLVQGGKDGATVKRLLKDLSVSELHDAAGAMLKDEWGGERASIGLLSSQINNWRQKAARGKKTGKRKLDYSQGI